MSHSILCLLGYTKYLNIQSDILLEDDPVKKIVVIYCLPLFLLIIFCFCGCAGYKKGYYSWPYTGGAGTFLPSPTTPYEINSSKILSLEDCKIYVSLNNEIQTSDMTYYLLLPVPVSLKDEPQYNQSAPFFYIKLAVNPKIDGVVIQPEKIRLIVDGIKYGIKEIKSAAETNFMIFWYYRSEQVRNLPLAQAENLLLVQDEWNNFAVYFNGSVPVVDRDIQLDLSEAIVLPDGLPLPVIRFKKVRYGQWYG